MPESPMNVKMAGFSLFEPSLPSVCEFSVLSEVGEDCSVGRAARASGVMMRMVELAPSKEVMDVVWREEGVVTVSVERM